MLEQNLFCIWLIVAIHISAEGSDEANASTSITYSVSNTATTMETTMTTMTTAMTNTKGFCCGTNQTSILCHMLRHLPDKSHDLAFGIGIASLVVLIASAVIIAVCCDRRILKRTPSTSSVRPTEANKDAPCSENQSPVRQGSEHPYYNESATAAAAKHGEPREPTPSYSTVYELVKQAPGEQHLNASNASDGCTYAEVAKTPNNLRPNHSNSAAAAAAAADDICEYADTAAVQRDVMRLPATTGGGYEEAVGPNGADSDDALWEESNPYEGALEVDADALKQRETRRRSRAEAFRMQNNCHLPLLDEDITLVDNSIYSNAAVIQRH